MEVEWEGILRKLWAVTTSAVHIAVTNIERAGRQAVTMIKRPIGGDIERLGRRLKAEVLTGEEVGKLIGRQILGRFGARLNIILPEGITASC